MDDAIVDDTSKPWLLKEPTNQNYLARPNNRCPEEEKTKMVTWRGRGERRNQLKSSTCAVSDWCSCGPKIEDMLPIRYTGLWVRDSKPRYLFHLTGFHFSRLHLAGSLGCMTVSMYKGGIGTRPGVRWKTSEVVDGLGEFHRFACHLQSYPQFQRHALISRPKCQDPFLKKSEGCRHEHAGVFGFCILGFSERPEPIPSCWDFEKNVSYCEVED